jgi:type II secretory pathway component PulK
MDLPADTLVRIRTAVARARLEHLGDLGPAAGLSDDAVARLAPVVTALPGTAPVNVNTMPEALFLALAADAAQARLMQGLRERQGSLTSGDLLALGIVLPPVAGFRSDHFTVRAQATVGGVTVARETRLERIATDGRPASVAIRSRTTVAPGADR